MTDTIYLRRPILEQELVSMYVGKIIKLTVKDKSYYGMCNRLSVELDNAHDSYKVIVMQRQNRFEFTYTQFKTSIEAL